jgi:uncharacterized protein
MFAWYELRTPDPAAARRFYADALGLTFREHDGRALLEIDGRACGEIGTLPEVARARGAPAHWLGHLAVPDPTAALASMIAHGAAPLGPERTVDGHRVIGVRDPSGVPVALTDRPEATPLAWHELHGAGPMPLAAYASSFDLEIRGSVTLEIGEYVLWAHRAFLGGAVASAQLPGVHPHWEHYFPVRSIDETLAAIGRLGGDPLPVRTTHDGAKIALAHDPAGASFGLREPVAADVSR